MLETVTVLCQECGRELAGDDPPTFGSSLPDTDEVVPFCLECWEREFGDSPE
jgi:hypothetical protein